MTGSVVYVIGTLDTKKTELRHAAACIAARGVQVRLVDVSTASHEGTADVTALEVAGHHPLGTQAIFDQPARGAAVSAMATALARYLSSRSDVAGVIGLGGSGNTSIVTAAMRALPVGIPKLMVSTMASGDVAPFVGETDIMMMYSVVDIAGLNAISRQVIANAANAIAAMALWRHTTFISSRAAVGLTMFGVTTPCVQRVQRALEGDVECLVFHATGAGGRSMEKLVDSGLLDTVIDVTTTEVADHLVGGILPCDEDRLGTIIRRKCPYVGSVGAVDMVNFGARETIPPRFAGRLFHIHNDQVTLMRTTANECRAIGNWIVDRLNRMEGPVRFVLPLQGLSALDRAGEPFHDPAADEALFDAIRNGWNAAPNRRLIEIDAHINDPAFSDELLRQFLSITPEVKCP